MIIIKQIIFKDGSKAKMKELLSAMVVSSKAERFSPVKIETLLEIKS
jgi:hypothetical protein